MNELTITLSLVERTLLVGVLSDMLDRTARDGHTPDRDVFNLLVELRAKLNGTLPTPTNHESVYVYALQRVLSLATAHKDDNDAARLRAAMTEITAFINHAFDELDALEKEAA